MQLHQLRYVVSVARVGSFSRAAEVLNRTQPAISQAIRRLEQEIEGVTLLRQASAAEALEALFDGQAEVAIVDAVSGVSAFPRGLRIVTYLTDEWYTAAVHIESQALLEAVNQSFVRLEETGQMAEMQARWLHGQ